MGLGCLRHRLGRGVGDDGLAGHSLSVLAVGLGAGRRDRIGDLDLAVPGRAALARAIGGGRGRAAIVVAAVLAVASAVIGVQAVIALVTRSHPATSGVTLIVAGISLIVLTPLAYAKRRRGAQMASRALHSDSTLSAIGAATSLLALTALVLNDTLGWWWADRVAALAVAAIAAAEAWHTAPHRQPP